MQDVEQPKPQEEPTEGGSLMRGRTRNIELVLNAFDRWPGEWMYYSDLHASTRLSAGPLYVALIALTRQGLVMRRGQPGERRRYALSEQARSQGFGAGWPRP
jgi:DNA-binding IclR family transcriptional regulator